MYSVNFLVGIFVVSLITRIQSCGCDYTDDSPATNELYGQNKCCHFAYAWSVSMSQMKEYVPSAEFYAKAVLPKHEIGFTEFDNPCDPASFLATIVDYPPADLTGIAYLVPIDEYKEYVKFETIRNGKRYQYLSTFNVEVKQNGQTTTINCNAILSAGLPRKKPCKSDLEKLVKIFKEANFPQSHIDRISQMPSEPSC